MVVGLGEVGEGGRLLLLGGWHNGAGMLLYPFGKLPLSKVCFPCIGNLYSNLDDFIIAGLQSKTVLPQKYHHCHDTSALVAVHENMAVDDSPSQNSCLFRNGGVRVLTKKRMLDRVQHPRQTVFVVKLTGPIPIATRALDMFTVEFDNICLCWEG